MRVALIHDWLLGMRGGEKVLEAIVRLVPQAEIFTLLADRSSLREGLASRKIHTSWLQSLPGVKSYYRKLLPWMPGAIERFDLNGFDLVVSSSHCVAKGVKAPAGVKHVCYCHTPMRYAWHLRDLYLERVPVWMRPWARSQLQRLRQWDQQTSSRVTQFIANGQTVQKRIQEAYGRESIVIHPPVDTVFYHIDSSTKREDYYLVVSALAPNKRIELAIEACRKWKKRLIVIGSGSERKRLERLADGSAQFLGWASNETIREHLQRCRALLFPGEEDFGIVPLEANACGTAVIALGVDGATETIKPMGQHPEPTGVWFTEPTKESLIEAIQGYEAAAESIRPEVCRRNAEGYSAEEFASKMKAVLFP